MTNTQVTIQDMVRNEVLANIFQSIVEDAAYRTVRSAYTTWIKESQDFATALVSVEGEIVAFPEGGGAKGQLGLNIKPLIDSQKTWNRGDVVVANDPYLTHGVATHLNDIHLLAPIFDDEENIVAFFWGFLHATDVGGAVPGSVSVHSKEIYQEGLRIRPVKLYTDGEVDERVKHFIQDNSRNPDDIWGDITALASSVAGGATQMSSLVKSHGPEAVRLAIDSALDSCEAAGKEAISKIPKGTYRFSEFFENDHVSGVPIRVAVAMTIGDDNMVDLDFTGTDPSVATSLNIPSAGKSVVHPFVCRALITFVATHSNPPHLNGGVMRIFRQTIQDGTVLHAQAPAACGGRFSTAIKAHEAVLGCLIQAVPELVPASGCGQLSMISVVMPGSGEDSGRVVAANPVHGGSGGGPHRDGVAGTDRTSGFLMNVPIEVLEAEADVLVHGYRIIPDSEGAGRLRGGFGIGLSLSTLKPDVSFVVRGQDRHRFQPWGVFGGEPGSNARCWSTVDGVDTNLGNIEFYHPEPGEVVTIVGAGGGGYGHPKGRNVAAVARDLEDGLVSAERAVEVYGVTVKNVGAGANEVTRASDEPDSFGEDRFDYGVHRTAWQNALEEVQDRVNELVWAVPAVQRNSVKVELYQEIVEAVKEDRVSRSDLSDRLDRWVNDRAVAV